MITKAFRDAMLQALERETAPERLEEACPQIAEGLPSAVREGASMDVLLPVCWLIEYNEAVPPAERKAGEQIRVLNAADYADLMAQGLPDAFYEAIRQDTRLDNPSYQFYIKYFKESKFDGRSIVRIGLGLHMTADEINRVLLSYGKQTISWNRVDDLLFRYALIKGWSYGRFEKVYLAYAAYRAALEKEEAGKTQDREDGLTAGRGIGPEQQGDSAYMTRYNKRKLESLLRFPDTPDSDAQLYRMLHENFIDTERAANGAPRRTLAKTCRWAHGDFSLSYASALLGREEDARSDFGECPLTKALVAYQMVMEAAGEAPSPALMRDAQGAAELVNRVIRAVNDLCGGFKTASHPPLPRGIDHFGGESYFGDLRRWRPDMLLRPETLADRPILTLIAECLYRDLPQEYQADDRLSAAEGPRRHAHTEVILKAAGIALNRGSDEREINRCFENALRRGVFHLLLCCGSSKARRMLNLTIRDTLVCLGWTDWDGMISPQRARELAQALAALPKAPAEEHAGAPGRRKQAAACAGALLREIMSLFSFAGLNGEEKKKMMAALNAAQEADRAAWISSFLDEKMRRALRVLEYTPEQQQDFSMVWDSFTRDEKEYCLFNHLRKQYVTERDISEPISMALNIDRPLKIKNAGQAEEKGPARPYIELSKRNSEPSRNLILFIALVMFGYFAEKDERGFTKENCERFISDSIRSAWAAAWQLSRLDDQLDETVDRLITHTFSHFAALKKERPALGPADRWQRALKRAGAEYRKECRDAEIRAMLRYKSFHWLKIQLLSTQNELFSTALMAGQWKYGREAGRKKTEDD